MLETVLYPDELKHRVDRYQHCQYNQIHPKEREQHLISFLNIKYSIYKLRQSVIVGIKKEVPFMVRFVPNLGSYEGLEGGGTGGSEPPLPVPRSLTSHAFISTLPPFSILLLSPIN